MVGISTLDLMKQNPRAWKALPSAYREDDCLVFYEDVNGALCCRAKDEDEEKIIGSFEYVYDESMNQWLIGEDKH